MSATGDPEGPGKADDPLYFQTIERAFIRLRGAPLLLSPADWQIARRWYRQGISLELVLRVLEEVFERHREKETKNPITRLGYCSRAVEKAFQEQKELTATATRTVAEALDPAPRLEALAAALPATLDPALRQGFAERLRGLAGASPEAVEEALAGLDEELLAAAEAALGEDARGALEAAIQGTLVSLAARLPADEVERARHRLRRQLLRERQGLPLLSLFSPQAMPPDPD